MNNFYKVFLKELKIKSEEIYSSKKFIYFSCRKHLPSPQEVLFLNIPLSALDIAKLLYLQEKSCAILTSLC